MCDDRMVQAVIFGHHLKQFVYYNGPVLPAGVRFSEQRGAGSWPSPAYLQPVANAACTVQEGHQV